MTGWKGRKACKLDWPPWMAVPRDDRFIPEPRDQGPMALAVIVILTLAGIGMWANHVWAQTPQRQPTPLIVQGGSSSSSSGSSAYTTCRMVGHTNVCTTQVDGHTTTTECRWVGKTQQCVTR
jgi:hypothetical protein